MRRVAMLLGTVGLIALGLTANPAQARDGGSGYSASHQQGWHQPASRDGASRHDWRQRNQWRPWFYRQGHYAPPSYYAPRWAQRFNFR